MIVAADFYTIEVWTAKGLQRFLVLFFIELSQRGNHQGLGNRLIFPDAAAVGTAGVIQRRERLGGMLNYYRAAA